jgi:SAM-dependent methyltransferase
MTDDYKPETYGETIAEIYDERHISFDEDAVSLLAELAGGGRALELGIGTGRIALPLAARGVEVHGIDASPAMVERLRAKPGGVAVPVTFGDFAEVPVAVEYSLIYVVFNTFFALLTQEDQVRCFQRVAQRLAPGGVFLIEAFVPDMTFFNRGQNFKTVEVTARMVEMHAAVHDISTQGVRGQHIIFKDGAVRLYPVQIRYCWPSELDLMARLAGLSLRERWAGWRKETFTSETMRHVSVYARKP